MSEIVPTGYGDLLGSLKERIKTAQIQAALAVNSELIRLYWEIGESVVREQEAHQWSDKVLTRLADDLQAAFPDMQGFSRTNVYRMRAFYRAYRNEGAIVPQAVGQLPWGHNAALIEKIKDNPTRLWYAEKTIQNGLSRPVLEHQIGTRLHERQGKAITNFDRTLPPA